MKKFWKPQQKRKEPEEVNEDRGNELLSKSWRLNAKKRPTNRFHNVNTESLLSNKKNLKIKRKNEALRKKLEGSKSHGTPSPQISARLNDTPNSKTGSWFQRLYETRFVRVWFRDVFMASWKNKRNHYIEETHMFLIYSSLENIKWKYNVRWTKNILV